MHTHTHTHTHSSSQHGYRLWMANEIVFGQENGVHTVATLYMPVTARLPPVTARLQPVTTGYRPVTTGYNRMPPGYDRLQPLATGYRPVTTGCNKALILQGPVCRVTRMRTVAATCFYIQSQNL